MKKLFSFPFALMLAFTLAFSGCTKEEDEPDDPNGPVTPVNTSEFKWTVNNGTTPVIADSAVYYPKFTTIYAYKGGTLNTVEINLSDLVVGTYTVSSVTGNQLIYESNGNTFNANAGTINITANAANLISGDFSCTFNNAQVSSISGTFKELKHR